MIVLKILADCVTGLGNFRPDQEGRNFTGAPIISDIRSLSTTSNPATKKPVMLDSSSILGAIEEDTDAGSGTEIDLFTTEGLIVKPAPFLPRKTVPQPQLDFKDHDFGTGTAGLLLPGPIQPQVSLIADPLALERAESGEANV